MLVQCVASRQCSHFLSHDEEDDDDEEEKEKEEKKEGRVQEYNNNNNNGINNDNDNSFLYDNILSVFSRDSSRGSLVKELWP